MTYATDGKCHNANKGTYGHECGKPATWIGTKDSAYRSGFCDHCKNHGDERVNFKYFERIHKPLIQTAAALPIKPDRIKSDRTQRSMADTPLFDRDMTGRLI